MTALFLSAVLFCLGLLSKIALLKKQIVLERKFTQMANDRADRLDKQCEEFWNRTVKAEDRLASIQQVLL